MSDRCRRNARWWTAFTGAGTVLIAAAIAGLVPPDGAAGQDRNFAGSLQENYKYVPTDNRGRNVGVDGFTTELSLKLAMDFNEHVSGNVKVCYGCHGFEVSMAFTDLRIADELNFRIGRFIPTFGEFPLRHDVANHRTNDKPLAYDMGRMLRLREWNMAVLPAPYVDNGIEINGTHWFGKSFQLDYAVFGVGGLQGPDKGIDFDYRMMRSRNLYYIDNNSRPSIGGRVALSWDISLQSLVSLGVSGMWGTYDPDNDLQYLIGGVDLYMRLGRLDLRAEYLIRRTEMHIGKRPEQRFRYGPGQDGQFDDFWLKDGFYVEANVPLGVLELVARFDGMRRIGNVLASSELRKESLVLRYTGGFNIVFHRSLRLKATGEFYDFSNFDDEVAVNLALVAVL